jgi:hypothetical protein
VGCVAGLPLLFGVVFLAEEADVVAEVEQFLEQGVGVVGVSGAVEGVGEPEGAGEGSCLRRRGGRRRRRRRAGS